MRDALLEGGVPAEPVDGSEWVDEYLGPSLDCTESLLFLAAGASEEDDNDDEFSWPLWDGLRGILLFLR
jgi:hypothetical protein